MESLSKTLIVDASILFSFFKSDSTRKSLIERLIRYGCSLISPEFVFEELYADKEKIISFSGISFGEFSFLYSLLRKHITSVSKEEYKGSLAEARSLSPHKEDTKDDPYFALALSCKCPIWSDEKGFKKQTKVEVFTTKEWVDKFKL